MDDLSQHERAVELLQQLGLQEYEAKCFVALSRVPRGTAKEISDISEVPRTRVYDAVRVLESKGLVEVQHSNPQLFRAVPVEEAVSSLKDEYVERTGALRDALDSLEPAAVEDDREISQEVWALSNATSITNRTRQLVAEADEEVVLVVGHASIFTESLASSLREAQERGVRVIVGAVSKDLQSQIEETLADVEVFVSGLEWLGRSVSPDDGTEVGRLLLVDRTSILVSTYHGTAADGRHDEQAVFGQGFANGFVTVARRLMTTGFLSPEGGID